MMGFNLKVTCIIELEEKPSGYTCDKGRDPGSAAVGDTLKRPRAHGGEEERCILKTWLWNGRRAPCAPEV